jgi:RNase H-fold protein (predicted Holliday junction resolvase)
MFDYLCIDWGHLRCGLAFGSSQTGLIIPFQGDLYTDDIYSTLKKEVLARKIKKIVVGKPTNFHMQDTEVTTKIEVFTNKLRILYPEIDFYTENERNSSKIAKMSSLNLDKFTINHLAAVEILKFFFSRTGI